MCDAGVPCMLPLREGSPAHSLLHHFPLAGAAASLSVPPRRLEGSWSDRLSVSRAGFSWGPADALVSARAGTSPRRVVPHACCTARLEFCFCFLNHIDDIVPRGSVHARDRDVSRCLLRSTQKSTEKSRKLEMVSQFLEAQILNALLLQCANEA